MTMQSSQTPDIDWALRSLNERRKRYAKYQDYYDGNHALAFATKKFTTAFGKLFEAFADNICASVVDALVDRLQIRAFTVQDSGAGNGAGAETVRDQAQEIWDRNRMDKRAGDLHLEAAKAGDAYLIVWPDEEGQVRLYPNLGSVMTIRYDDEDPERVAFAAKLWQLSDKRYRLNLYYADRIEKWVTTGRTLPVSGGAFKEVPGDGEPWPIPNPWGIVPVFHFANNSSLATDFGHSELRDVIPLQDALNKAIADLLVGMEFHALPRRWATGIDTEIDERTGQPKEMFDTAVGRLWASANENARFGQFDAANLDQLLHVVNDLLAQIARVSKTPMHVLMLNGDQYPSGEALKTAEAPFVKKVQDRQVAFGNPWEDAMHLALLMERRLDVRLNATWQNAAPRSEREDAETAVLKKQIGVSNRQLQREQGYTEEEIETMADEAREERAEVGEGLLRSFDAGAAA